MVCNGREYGEEGFTRLRTSHRGCGCFILWGRTDSFTFLMTQKWRSCRHQAGDKHDSTGVLRFNFESVENAEKVRCESIGLFLVGEDGFEPSKRNAADLQSVPFGHSGTPPYSICSGAGRRTRTPDLLITNQLLYQLSYTGGSTEHWYYTTMGEKVKHFFRFFEISDWIGMGVVYRLKSW